MQKTNIKKSQGIASEVPIQLLPYLSALLNTGSITRAAEHMGLSQPAMSRAVMQLRQHLNDPLLVRTSKGYQLTPLTLNLTPQVESAMSAARTIFRAAHFDAKTTTREFFIASTDYGALTVLTKTAPKFSQQASHASMTVLPWQEGTLESLERGEIDCALYADAPLPPDFHARELFRESYVLIVRRGHPLERSGATGAALLRLAAQFRHVVAHYPSGRTLAADDVLARLGKTQHSIAVAIPYFLMATEIVANSDLIMALPSKVASNAMRTQQLCTLSLGTSIKGFSYRLIWHARSHSDLGHQWFRRFVVDTTIDARHR